MNINFDEYAVMFKALSDPNRLLIIDYLLEGELCACKILEKLNITQSTLSYHMKILFDCNLVSAYKKGKWMHYTLNKEKMSVLMELLYKYSNESNSSIIKKCSCK